MFSSVLLPSLVSGWLAYGLLVSGRFTIHCPMFTMNLLITIALCFTCPYHVLPLYVRVQTCSGEFLGALSLGYRLQVGVASETYC